MVIGRINGCKCTKTTPPVCKSFWVKDEYHKSTNFVKEFYHMVELGTPFISRLPEEFVLTALLGKEEYRCWRATTFRKLDIRAGDKIDTPEKILEAKNAGYFFYVQAHNNLHTGTPQTLSPR